MDRNGYHAFRRAFAPANVTLALVAESPPASGKYFYNPEGLTTEWLFAALMKRIGCTPTTKEAGLRELQRKGWLLVDATYEPINKLKGAKRAAVIVRDYPLLRADLAALLPDRAVPLVLLKANVCRLLEPLLKRDGFNVINKGCVVYFPSHSRQPDFHRQFGNLIAPFVNR
jgi:hypothetical protein